MRRIRNVLSSPAIRRLRRIVRIAFTSAVALLVLCLVAAVAFAGQRLSEAEKLIHQVPALTDPSKAPMPGPMAYYSADGVLLGRQGSEQRVVLSPKQIPQVMRDASVAIEDQRFYQHNGVDIQGALRALWVDLRARSAVQGGSTITMQYIRNVYLDFSKNANRKLSEVALALQLEGTWTKERILTAYLNTVYYGNGAYGVEAAAQTYFAVHANQLTTAQAALLAGLVQSPSRLDPRRHPQAAVIRRNQVLDEMYAQGMISLSKLQDMKQAKLKLRRLTKSERPAQPALMELLRRESAHYLSAAQRRDGGLKVYATFKMRDIEAAQRILRSAYSGSGSPTVASGWVEARSGRVLVAAHSGKASSFFDFSWQAKRQPGSTVKAFTAAQNLLNGGQLSDAVDNSPLAVQNGRRRYTIQPTQGGVNNVYDALRFSQNPANWRLYQKAGPKKVLQLEKKFNLTGMDANAAASLGGVKVGTNPLSLAGAFAVFAGDGRRAPVHAVQRIADRIDNNIWDDAHLIPHQLYPDEYARQMNVALQRVVNEGFPQLKANLPISNRRHVAGKTGTTEKNGDAWFAGYVPQMAGTVWTGYANSTKPLTDSSGATVWGLTVPAQTWNKIASYLLAGKPDLKFPRPRGVQLVPKLTGRSKEQALALLARYGFRLPQPSSRFSAQEKPNQVLSQADPAGSWVKPGLPFSFIFAVDQRPAPNLIGEPFLEAEKELGSFSRLQLRFAVSSRPLGEIIAQDPVAGYPLKYHAPIIVTVATSPGPERKVIKRVPYVPSDSELALLRSQLAQAQSSANNTATQTVVPSLIGLSPEQAQLVLSSMGLRSRINGSGLSIVSQKPSGGSLVSANQTVSLSAN
jgi:penicillin-binding protein 1A